MKQIKMEERTKEVLGGLRLMVQEARAAVGRWRRRVMVAEDSDEEDDDLLFYVDDMLADAPQNPSPRVQLLYMYVHLDGARRH